MRLIAIFAREPNEQRRLNKESVRCARIARDILIGDPGARMVCAAQGVGFRDSEPFGWLIRQAIGGPYVSRCSNVNVQLSSRGEVDAFEQQAVARGVNEVTVVAVWYQAFRVWIMWLLLYRRFVRVRPAWVFSLRGLWLATLEPIKIAVSLVPSKSQERLADVARKLHVMK